MLVIKEHADIEINYDIENICNKENTIYFDIETTGFSRKYNIVYLIGCMYYENGELFFTQYLAENHNEEAVILQEFYKKLSSFDTIIHFNGASFDMPFLTERGEKFNIDFNFNKYKSIDLYKLIKPFKGMLKLENLKQKSVEKLIGIKRSDPFSGGELIEVYNRYVQSKDARLLKALLMHNMEDVFYMGSITSILSFTDLMSGDFSVVNYNFSDYKDINGNPARELCILLNIKNKLPFMLSHKKNNIYISGKDNTVNLSIKVISGNFKYFFSNYKDYYYLPDEDIAMHKSVASFVDKNHRKNATAATCYIKKTGEFLPIFAIQAEDFGELFKIDYTDKVNFVCADKICNENISLYSKIILLELSR